MARVAELPPQAGDELAGLDALEREPAATRPRVRKIWSAAWPKLAAFVIVLVVWQIVVWSGWKPSYVFPGPGAVFRRLASDFSNGTLPPALRTTMGRAILGYGLAVAAGSLIGAAVVRVSPLRAAIGSLISGLQTMPSIAWFPLAIILWGLSEKAILFVVVLGAAPSIANGLISGVDHIPPLLLRAGRVLGARGTSLFRHVVLPGAMPGYLDGLKQGWAFAWRSLMAGELLVIIEKRPSVGVTLSYAREFVDTEGVLATMIVILAIGIIVDGLFFSGIGRAVRRRRGLVDQPG